jgi:predicted HTH transcriptional regulator
MNGMRRDDYYANKLSPFAPLKSTQKTPQKTPQKILAAIRANPSVGTQEMADMIGVERSTVARAIAKLKRDGILRRVGPDKGGHWEVMER